MNYKYDYLFLIPKTLRTKEENAVLVGKLNEKLKELREYEADVNVSVLTYNNTMETVVYREDVKEVQDFTTGLVSSRAKRTAFYDSAILAMDTLGLTFANMAEDERPCRVTIVFPEMPEDNASAKYTKSEFDWIVGEQAGIYSWKFETI